MNEAKEQKLLKIVQDNYEAIALEFDVTRKNNFWPYLSKITNKVASNERILDVGCGNGRLLQNFRNQKIDYIGTDASNNLIALAQKNTAKDNELSEVTYKYYVNDVLELDKLALGQFDWVFSIAVIHHLPSQGLQLKALLNMKNKMKPSGRMVISVWRPWGNKLVLREFIKTLGRKIIGRHPYAWNDLVFAWRNSQSPRYYHFFTKCELKRLVKKAGLEIVDFHSEKRNYYLVLK